MSDYVLHYALTTSSIPLKWISKDCSSAVYNKSHDIITTEIEQNGKKNLTKKIFSQILELDFDNQFETPIIDVVLRVLNEMGYTPYIKMIDDFKNSNIPFLWNYFFGIILQCIIGRNSRPDKEKHSFYIVLYGVYYNVKVDYASIL